MSRGWILMGAPELFNNDGGGGKKRLFSFFTKNAYFKAARSCLCTYGWCSHVFVVCFRRCGRVRKKHHCEADEDSTRQWLQRRVSAEFKWAFSHYIYVYIYLYMYIYTYFLWHYPSWVTLSMPWWCISRECILSRHCRACWAHYLMQSS